MRQPDYPSADAASWHRVDTYFADRLAPDDAVLREALAANAAGGLPVHDVSAVQGQLLALIIQMAGAERVLEIGTLGGYSTIRMARALPPAGRIVTIESDPKHAAVARANLERAGLADRVDLRIGKALDVLPTLSGSFDFIFIDADKPNNPRYLDWAMKLSRPGTVIVGDNVVRGGAVADPHSTDPNVLGVRRFIDLIADDPRLSATAIQTVGEKGWDGFALARVASSSPILRPPRHAYLRNQLGSVCASEFDPHLRLRAFIKATITVAGSISSTDQRAACRWTGNGWGPVNRTAADTAPTVGCGPTLMTIHRLAHVTC